MVNSDFPRYRCTLDELGNKQREEYNLGKFYVKIYPTGSQVHILNVCVIIKPVYTSELLWIDSLNQDNLLDKIMTIHYTLSPW